MNKFVILLIFISWIAKGSYTPKESLPSELQFYVNEVLQDISLKNIDLVGDQFVLKIDHALQQFSSNSETMFFIKSEFYKSILEYPIIKKLNTYSNIDRGHLEKLKDKINKLDRVNYPFTYWLAKSLYIELSSMIESPVFLSLNNKNKTKVVEEMRENLELLNPWVYFFNESKVNDIKLTIIDIKKVIFNNIIQSVKIYNNPVKTKNLVYFTKDKSIKAKTNDANLSSEQKAQKYQALKTMDNIGDIEEAPEIKIPDPQWTPKDSKIMVEAKDRDSHPVPIHTPDPNWKPFDPPRPINDWEFKE